MAVTLYRSIDASAPVNSGAAGDVVNILDKCLVAGYGAKTAAGWSKPYTGTNKAAFRQGAGNLMYTRVHDDNLSAPTRSIRHRGYETMSDVDTGTGPHPTVAQVAGDGQVLTTGTTGVSRPWIIVADSRTAYLFFDFDGTGYYRASMFGEPYSYVSADSYRHMNIDENLWRLVGWSNPSGTTGIESVLTGHYIARKWDGSGTSLNVGKHGNSIQGSNNGQLMGVIPNPNPADGKQHLAPVYVHEIAEPTVRGELRGFWHWAHPVSGLASGDRFSGLENFPGKEFIAILELNGSVFWIETTDTWKTN